MFNASPNYLNTLRQASSDIKESAQRRWEELTENPTVLDEMVPVISEQGPSVETVASYLDSHHKDEMSDQEMVSMLSQLAEHVRDRRQLQIDLRGVIYDPIDDAFAIPKQDDIRRYMDASHKKQYEQVLDKLYGPDPALKGKKVKVGTRIISMFSKRP